MIPKEDYVLITFHTTAEAIAMEKFCHGQKLPGRLIPVPREISAGCGLTWAAPPQEKEHLLDAMAQQNMRYDEVYEMKI